MPIAADEVYAAAVRLNGRGTATPCTASKVLSGLTGAHEERGALNRLLQLLPGERDAGVCALSAGNHAQAVAYHVTALGMKSVVVMPKNTPFTKVRNTRHLGGAMWVCTGTRWPMPSSIWNRNSYAHAA